VDIGTDDRISALKSLLRGPPEKGGRISPADFIYRSLRDIGLIVSLGEWVWREACTEAAKWPVTSRSQSICRQGQFRKSRNLARLVDTSALAHSSCRTFLAARSLKLTELMFLAGGGHPRSPSGKSCIS